MTTFNQRLAHLADRVRNMEGGTEIARELMLLTDDMDTWLHQRSSDRQGKGVQLFVKWNEFLNASVEEAYTHGREQLVIERRKMARRVATSPLWQGGYADALGLFEE